MAGRLMAGRVPPLARTSRPATPPPHTIRRVAQVPDQVAMQEFVVAVREQHQGSASEAALQARLGLAVEYLDADLVDDAIEMLMSAVIDAGRLFGPNDERTFEVRARLGEAYVGGGHLYDAYGVHAQASRDAVAALGADSPLAAAASAALAWTERLLVEEHGPALGYT